MARKNINGLQVDVTNNGRITIYAFFYATNKQVNDLIKKISNEYGEVDCFMYKSDFGDKIDGYLKAYNW